MMSSSNNIIQQIEVNEITQYFLKPENHQNNAVKSMTIGTQVKHLSNAIDSLSEELQRQVVANYEHLLRQGDHATKLQFVLNAMNEHVQNLVTNANRLRIKIVEPYTSLELHTIMVERLHCASDILRQVNNIQQLYKNLLNATDPVQKATIVYELERLATNDQLNGIDLVTAKLRNVRSQRHKIMQLANSALNQGISDENSAQTINALQIFMNLRTLESTVEYLIDSSLDTCREFLQTAVNCTVVSSTSGKNRLGPGGALVGSSKGFRNRLWTELEKVFAEDIYTCGVKMQFLDKAIINSNIGVKLNTEHQFWKKLSTLMLDDMKKCQPAVQQTLEEEYPKLVKFYSEMFEKLKSDKVTYIRQVFESYETLYLANSFAKLLEPIENMFSDLNTPNTDHIDVLIRVISNEISVALIDDHLTVKICRNIGKAIKMFTVKTEQQIRTGLEAAQVIAGVINSCQQRNLNYANILYYLQMQMERCLLINYRDTIGLVGCRIIQENLEHLTVLTKTIIHPLVAAINVTIEKIIVTIHQEGDWDRVPISKPINWHSTVGKITNCSPYMKELQEFLTRVYNIYLEPFDNKQVLLSECSQIAVRSIELLICHSVILRPLNSGGRQRLHTDYLQLEHCLKHIYPQLEALGKSYRLLKSMASLVKLENAQEIVDNHVVNSPVPHSVILLLLFSFAASETLASPHQNTGWSATKLSTWLDEHPNDSDRLDLIAGALQRYEIMVRQQEEPFWDPVYPIMAAFLEKAIAFHCK